MKKQQNGEKKNNVSNFSILRTNAAFGGINRSQQLFKSLHGDAELSKRLLPLQSPKTVGCS